MPVTEESFLEQSSSLIWVALGAIALSGETDRSLTLNVKQKRLQAVFSVLKYEFRTYFPAFDQLNFQTIRGFPHSSDVDKILHDLVTSSMISRIGDDMLTLELDDASVRYVEDCLASIEDDQLLFSEFNRLVEKLKWLILHHEDLATGTE